MYDKYIYHNKLINVKWLNKDVADRYVLSTYVEVDKLELLQKAQSDA